MRPNQPCAVVNQVGPCGQETAIQCFVCKRPVCAACSEDSWLAECNYHCPECWEKVPDAPPESKPTTVSVEVSAVVDPTNCEHDVKPKASDPNWGQCVKCDEGGFPMTDLAAYGPTSCDQCQDTGIVPKAMTGTLTDKHGNPYDASTVLADGPCPNGCGDEP